MGINYFTDEQIELLKGNPYIEKVSKKSIKYSEQFKTAFWLRYSQDESPSMLNCTFSTLINEGKLQNETIKRV